MSSGVLSDKDISREIHDYRRRKRVDLHEDPDGLDIDPFRSANIQPASYDLTLGSEFQRNYMYSPGTPQSVSEGAMQRETQVVGEDIDEMRVMPGEFVLAHTEEVVELPPHISGEVKGRSSIGRMGLIPHTAGWIDPGFKGQITLEFVNHSARPIIVEPGQRIAQIVFSYTNEPSANPYGEKGDAKYQGQTGVTESRVEQDE